MIIKKYFWVAYILLFFPIACSSPYDTKDKKNIKGGYIGSITDKLTGALSAKEHKTLGITYFKKGMTEEAIDEFNFALQGIRQDGELHHYLGKAYLEINQFSKAMNELNNAISYYDKSNFKGKAEAYNDLGLLYKKKNEYTEAFSALKECLKLNPSMAEAYYTMALLYLETNKINESFDYLNKAIKLDSNNPDFHFSMGLAFYKKKHAGKSAYRVPKNT